jgi:hypothetical protein
MGTRTVHGLSEPQALQVITAPDGTPHALRIGDRRRAVVAIREDWLVQDRWWTSEPVDRHYFELLVEPGRVMVIYRELRTNQWFRY